MRLGQTRFALDSSFIGLAFEINSNLAVRQELCIFFSEAEVRGKAPRDFPVPC